VGSRQIREKQDTFQISDTSDLGTHQISARMIGNGVPPGAAPVLAADL
jgi:hypothetical protein